MIYRMWIATLLSLPAPVYGTPYIELVDRVEINWTKLRVQFYGYDEPPFPGSQVELKAIEKRAWREGIAYIAKKAKEIYVTNFESIDFNTKQLSDYSQEVALGVAQATMSTNTVYFPNGGVQVVLESALTQFLKPKGLKFIQKESAVSGSTHYTGIHVKLDRKTRPQVFYKIVAEDGKLLFDYRSLAEESFAKSLSGRWVIKPQQSEVEDLVGAQPVAIEARVLREGLFQVQRQEWDNALLGHKGLLASCTILLSMPSS